MKNYQRIKYQNYYAQDVNGDYIQVSKKACFAPGEPPTTDNPLKQRWFYDEEAGYAVRLERNKANEDMHRFNSSFLKREERYDYRKFSCIWKDTNNCDQDCNRCNRKNTSRTVELDKTWTSNGEMGSRFELADESQDIMSLLGDKELISTLLTALQNLSADDKELFHFLLNKEKKKVIADCFNITVDGVRYKEQQLRKKLLSNKDLRILLEKY